MGVYSRRFFWLILFLFAGPIQALEVTVEVTGLADAQQQNVLALLAIAHQEAHKLTQDRLEALNRKAPEQIRKALEPFGFYQVKIQAQLQPPSTEKDPWIARYQVDPGEPVKIGQIDYQILGPGAADSAFPKQFPMQVGAVLDHETYEKARDQLRAIAAKQGYLEADLVQHQVLVDLKTNRALVIFHLETGPKYYLGEVRFDQDLLDEDLLRRYVNFSPGTPYDPELLLRLQSRLLGTQYYSQVEIEPQLDQAVDHQVPILVKAKPNKANKYRLGLGYGTDVGPRMILEWQRHYLTSWGHRLKAELKLSQTIQSILGEYRIPMGDPTRDYLLIRPEFDRYDTATREGDRTTLQVAYSVLTDTGWRRTLGIDYRYENYVVNREDSAAVNELVPNISWSKTVTDDPIYTTDGYRLKYSLQGAVEGLVSQASYLSAALRLKWIRAFGEHYRFITRADLGATWANCLLDLPASRRFFAGGDSSVRGWGYEALGPTDPRTDETLGGRYLAVGSLELERQLWGNWSAAIFTDFGNAFDPDYVNKVAVGAGLGIRWRSPIGQVRVDVAYALNKDDPGARLHLVLGPDL